MKTKHTLLLILLSVILYACKKEEENSPGPSAVDTSVYFKCKLNGVNYTDDARFADYFLNRARVVSQNNEELMRIDISDDTTGTFVVSPTNEYTAIYYIDSNSASYTATTGTIVITEFNKQSKRISGTFSGVMVNDNNANDKVIITEGKFNYIELLPF